MRSGVLALLLPHRCGCGSEEDRASIRNPVRTRGPESLRTPLINRDVGECRGLHGHCEADREMGRARRDQRERDPGAAAFSKAGLGLRVLENPLRAVAADCNLRSAEAPRGPSVFRPLDAPVTGGTLRASSRACVRTNVGRGSAHIFRVQGITAER